MLQARNPGTLPQTIVITCLVLKVHWCVLHFFYRYNIDDLAPGPVSVESSQTGGNKCAADAQQKMDKSLITKGDLT